MKQRILLLAGLALIAACGDTSNTENPEDTQNASDTSTTDATPDTPDSSGPLEVPFTSECENLNPQHCLLPFPTDRYLAEDPASVTGWSLSLVPEAMPKPKIGGSDFNPEPYRRHDGFSPSSQIVTVFPEPVDLTGLPSLDNPERSLEADSPTLLIDLETGDLIPHWVENDARPTPSDETLFYIRPMSRLEHDRSYAVALRALQGESGAELPTTEVFAALRDGVITNAPQLEARRPTFETLFSTLEAQGIERSRLLAAWTWHTASQESTVGDMLTMREDALTRLGPDGIGCTITSVEDGFSGAYRRVRGTYTVPSYMTQSVLPAELARDENDDPVFVENIEVGFTAILPQSLASTGNTGPLLTWGHGLFGDAEGTISGEGVIQVAEDAGMVIVATDWAGMSNKDLSFLATALGDVSLFYMIGDMLRQGMINQIALTRSFAGVCATLPEMTNDTDQPLIDTNVRYFLGGSQGSILGGTLLTLSPDIDRGALIVGGAAFSFMIERSIHFKTFELLLSPSYPRRIDTGILMVLSQQVWDMAESASYLPFIVNGLDTIGGKEFLYMVAKNDAQVSNLSSEIAARIADIPTLEGSVDVPWGTETVTSPYAGPAAYVSIDVGDRDPVSGNRSPDTDDGGHGSVAFQPESIQMIRHFLETGEILNTCSGVCDLTP